MLSNSFKDLEKAIENDSKLKFKEEWADLWPTKNLFAQTITDHIFGTNERDPVKLDNTRNLWYLLLHTLWLLLPKFNFI